MQLNDGELTRQCSEDAVLPERTTDSAAERAVDLVADVVSGSPRPAWVESKAMS